MSGIENKAVFAASSAKLPEFAPVCDFAGKIGGIRTVYRCGCASKGLTMGMSEPAMRPADYGMGGAV